jgi:hypothetical protein
MAKEPTERTNRQRIEPLTLRTDDYLQEYEIQSSLAISTKRIADALEKIEQHLLAIVEDLPNHA